MEFHEVQSAAKIQIQSYQNGVLTINGEVYRKNVIALPDRLIEDWLLSNTLQISDCKIFKTFHAEVILLGVGAKLIFPDAKIIQWFREQNLGVEFMDTAAACRTFQILAAEGRKVVAGLIL